MNNYAVVKIGEEAMDDLFKIVSSIDSQLH